MAPNDREVSPAHVGIHHRIDGVEDDVKSMNNKIDGKLDKIQSTLTQWVTLCERCYPTVMGNGDRRGLAMRVDRIEQGKKRDEKEDRISSIRFWAVLASMTTLISAFVSVVAKWLLV